MSRPIWIVETNKIRLTLKKKMRPSMRPHFDQRSDNSHTLFQTIIKKD